MAVEMARATLAEERFLVRCTAGVPPGLSLLVAQEEQEHEQQGSVSEEEAAAITRAFHSGEAVRTRALLAMPVLSEQQGRCMGVLWAKPASPSPSRTADAKPSGRSLALEQPAVGDVLMAAAQALGAAAPTLRAAEATAVKELLRGVHKGELGTLPAAPDERRMRLHLLLRCAVPAVHSLPRRPLRRPHAFSRRSV